MAGQSLVKFLNKFELNRNSWGGDVEDVKWECASTRPASGASGEADTGPHQSGERGGSRSEGRQCFAGAHAGDEGVWG